LKRALSYSQKLLDTITVSSRICFSGHKFHYEAAQENQQNHQSMHQFQDKVSLPCVEYQGCSNGNGKEFKW
jgi:hypothetical protein